MDTMRCKHCAAIVALIPRAAVVGRFTLLCLHCGVRLVIWPPERVTVAPLPAEALAAH